MIATTEKMALYKIRSLETDGAKGIAHIEIDREHPIFKGHFPNNPITPGACLIQIGAELAQLSEPQYTEVVQIRNAKFVKMIKPDEHVVVFKWEIKTRDEQSIQATFEVCKQDTRAAKFNIHFAK